MKTGHLLRKRVVLPVLVVMALLLVGLPTVRLMAQEEQGSIPGLVLNSNAPGELVVSWAPASQGYPSWRDANEDDRSNAYPDGSARSHTVTGLPAGAEYKVRMRARYFNDGDTSPQWSGPWEEATVTLAGAPEPTPELTPTATPEPAAGGAIRGLSLASDAEGELTVSWETADPAPSDYRVSWAPADQDYLGWQAENETQRGNAYPGGGETSLTLTGLPSGAEYQVFSNRAFSAAVATWANGRTEALAVCPGIPSVAEQERRDKVPRGTYQRLVDDGSLIVAEGLRVPPVGLLWNTMTESWGWPALVVCDRFRLRELQDVAGDAPIETRRALWSEASEDIRACRKLVKDGPLSLAESARALLVTSLAHSKVQADTSGNIRMVKKGHKNESRDDVAFALTLTCGAFVRYPPVAVVEPTGPVVVG